MKNHGIEGGGYNRVKLNIKYREIQTFVNEKPWQQCEIKQ